MKEIKEKSMAKPKIQNISLDQFEQMAIEAAEAVQMPSKEAVHLCVSFQKMKNSEGENNTSFAVHYFLKDQNYYGNSITPEMAIQTAIDNYLIKSGRTRINPQTKIEATTDKEQSYAVQFADGMLTLGARYVNQINKKFLDTTKVTTTEAIQFINEMFQSAI